jgi:hypothetical protein
VTESAASVNAVCAPRGIYIFELKVGDPVDKAFAQIRSKGYADRYLASGKPIWLIGLSFDPESRKLIECAAVPQNLGCHSFHGGP